MPTGSSNNPNEVPWASCCEKPRKKTKAGTTIIPPPTPTMPLNMPAASPINNKMIMICDDIFLVNFMKCRVILFGKFLYKTQEHPLQFLKQWLYPGNYLFLLFCFQALCILQNNVLVQGKNAEVSLQHC